MINAVILAAGRSQRLNKSIKKQYIPINGLPMLCHSVRVFDNSGLIDKIYLAVPKNDIEMCRTHIIKPLQLSKQIKLVSGGPTRQMSVLNALEEIKNYHRNKKDIVLIHDGARPFITKELILKCIKGTEETGACIPAIPATDSLKKVNTDNSSIITIPRKNIWLAQTPQVFSFDLIFKSYHWAKKNRFKGTDDSSIAEITGSSVKIVQGSSYNIKITTAHDLVLAKAISKTVLK